MLYILVHFISIRSNQYLWPLAHWEGAWLPMALLNTPLEGSCEIFDVKCESPSIDAVFNKWLQNFSHHKAFRLHSCSFILLRGLWRKPGQPPCLHRYINSSYASSNHIGLCNCAEMDNCSLHTY